MIHVQHPKKYKGTKYQNYTKTKLVYLFIVGLIFYIWKRQRNGLQKVIWNLYLAIGTEIMVFHHDEKQTKDVLLSLIYYVKLFDIMKAILPIGGGNYDSDVDICNNIHPLTILVYIG